MAEAPNKTSNVTAVTEVRSASFGLVLHVQQYACTYRSFAGTWRPLVSVITTPYYVAIIVHRRMWCRALSVRHAWIRSSGIILIP